MPLGSPPPLAAPGKALPVSDLPNDPPSVPDRAEPRPERPDDPNVVWSARYKCWGTWVQSDAIFVPYGVASGTRVHGYYRTRLARAAVAVNVGVSVDALRLRAECAVNAELRAAAEVLLAALPRCRAEVREVTERPGGLKLAHERPCSNVAVYGTNRPERCEEHAYGFREVSVQGNAILALQRALAQKVEPKGP